MKWRTDCCDQLFLGFKTPQLWVARQFASSTPPPISRNCWLINGSDLQSNGGGSKWTLRGGKLPKDFCTLDSGCMAIIFWTVVKSQLLHKVFGVTVCHSPLSHITCCILLFASEKLHTWTITNIYSPSVTCPHNVLFIQFTSGRKTFRYEALHVGCHLLTFPSGKAQDRNTRPKLTYPWFSGLA